MLVYEKDGAICVTFKGNTPVAIPEYTIKINEEDRTITVNNKVIGEDTTDVETTPEIPPVDETEDEVEDNTVVEADSNTEENEKAIEDGEDEIV